MGQGIAHTHREQPDVSTGERVTCEVTSPRRGQSTVSFPSSPRQHKPPDPRIGLGPRLAILLSRPRSCHIIRIEQSLKKHPGVPPCCSLVDRPQFNKLRELQSKNRAPCRVSKTLNPKTTTVSRERCQVSRNRLPAIRLKSSNCAKWKDVKTHFCGWCASPTDQSGRVTKNAYLPIHCVEDKHYQVEPSCAMLTVSSSDRTKGTVQ
eukprot:1182116-Prorocentrum_minimum.AAC.3